MASQSRVQSVDRALDLLEAIREQPDGLGLSEAARAVGLRVTTAHNLVSTLVQRGYLSKGGRPMRYHLGPRVAAWSGRSVAHPLEPSAEPVLCDLAGRQPAGSVILAVHETDQLRTLLRVHADRPAHIERPRSDILHPYGSATALLFQAFWPPERVASHRAQHPFWRFGEPMFETLDRYEKRLARVRRQGVAQVHAADFGYRLAAAPVRDREGCLRAALGAAVRIAESTPTTWKTTVRRLTTAAQRLSREAT